MVEKRPRRQFAAEFKAQAVRRVLEGGHRLAEVAVELGVSTGQLSTWRTEHLAHGASGGGLGRGPGRSQGRGGRDGPAQARGAAT